MTASSSLASLLIGRDCSLNWFTLLFEVDMKHSVMKSLSVKWIVSTFDYLGTEAGIVHGGFVEAGICETIDEAESDHDSEDDPFANIDEQ